MPTELELRCKCGKVRGHLHNVSPQTGNRLLCLCDDCQAYAAFLKRNDVLDENGGSDVFQVKASDLSLESGQEHVRCVRLTGKGLRRWYASCCNTPMANTLGPKGAFAGVLHCFTDHANDGRSRDEVLGPIAFKMHGRYGKGNVPSDVHPRVPVGAVFKLGGALLRWWLQGGAQPSAFYSPQGKPIAEEVRLSPKGSRLLREQA